MSAKTLNDLIIEANGKKLPSKKNQRATHWAISRIKKTIEPAWFDPASNTYLDKPKDGSDKWHSSFSEKYWTFTSGSN